MKIVEILEEFRKIFANERDKGTAFEKIVKIYLENEPKYRERTWRNGLRGATTNYVQRLA